MKPKNAEKKTREEEEERWGGGGDAQRLRKNTRALTSKRAVYTVPKRETCDPFLLGAGDVIAKPNSLKNLRTPPPQLLSFFRRYPLLSIPPHAQRAVSFLLWASICTLTVHCVRERELPADLFRLEHTLPIGFE